MSASPIVYYFIMHFCFCIFVFLCVFYVHIFIGCHSGVINDDDIAIFRIVALWTFYAMVAQLMYNA